MIDPLVIGVDVGGTKLAGVAVRGAEIVVSSVRPLLSGGLDDQVVGLARELEGSAGPFAAIGVAVPGQVDVGTGVIEMAVNLGAVRLPIGELVSAHLGVPCFVEHDARAVAAWLANQPGAPMDLAYLSVGTGISAGVVIGGRLLRGADGLAGEVGHLLADPAGPPCACGLVGCLEAIASGPAVARAAALELAAGAESALPALPEPADVYRAAGSGDPLAIRLVERAAFHLAAAVRGLALAYGVSRVVVGGGVTRAGAPFSTPLLAALDRERAGSTLARGAVSPGRVEVLDGGRPLGALGAAAVARHRLETPSPASDPEGEVALR
jgi:glucokinase